MATINVSSAAGLKAALAGAKGGDTILLASGSYGALSISGRDFASPVTIRSASGDDAVFKGLDLNNVSGVTISSVTIQGSGNATGTGLCVRGSEDVTIQDSTVSGFKDGILATNSDDLAFLNNSLSNIGYDGMRFAQTHGLLIQGNTVVMNSNPSFDIHKDVIQIFNQGKAAPASDIVIRNNVLSADDSVTHGIYMGNNDAKTSGSRSEYFSDVLIENNTVRTGHQLAMSIGQTDGLVIRGNTVLQHADVDSRKTVHTPIIQVAREATDVTITGNTGHKQPGAATNNWQPATSTGGNWDVSGNKTVPIGSNGSAPPAGPGAGGGATPPVDDLGNGRADTFRFDGDNVRGQTSRTWAADFSEGDRLVLSDYDASTFAHRSGGNPLAIVAGGRGVTIDSLADLREVVDASRRVTATVDDDDLVLHIRQESGTHHVTLSHLGDDFLAL